MEHQHLNMKMKSANCSVGEHEHCSGIFKTADRENLDTSWSCECGCHRKSGEPQAEASETEKRLKDIRWRATSLTISLGNVGRWRRSS